MLFKINTVEDFKKFAELAEAHRYVCYKSHIHNFMMLRPIKSSKHLDTALYNGEESKDLEKFINEKYSVITVSEITFLRE